MVVEAAHMAAVMVLMDITIIKPPRLHIGTGVVTATVSQLRNLEKVVEISMVTAGTDMLQITAQHRQGCMATIQGTAGMVV